MKNTNIITIFIADLTRFEEKKRIILWSLKKILGLKKNLYITVSFQTIKNLSTI